MNIQAVTQATASTAAKAGLTSRMASILADASLFLTFLAMTPYDKEVMQIIPPLWTPYVIKAGMFAQVALRLLKIALQKHENAESSVTPPTP